jgi:hypothetical protein
MAGIKSVIIYNDEEYTVGDVGYFDTTTLDGSTPKFTSSTKGELHYLLDFHNGDFWVLASDCDEHSEFFEQDTRSPHLTDLGYNMVGWLDGLEPHNDNEKLPPIVTLLMAIQYDKEGSYGSSWCGKGEYRGIMANIDRKYDRLDKMTEDEIHGSLRPLHEQEEILNENFDLYGSQVGESKVDAIADLAVYCLLYLTYVKEKYPRVFQIWVSRNVPPYLADKIPFV